MHDNVHKSLYAQMPKWKTWLFLIPCAPANKKMCLIDFLNLCPVLCSTSLPWSGSTSVREKLLVQWELRSRDTMITLRRQAQTTLELTCSNDIEDNVS